MTISLGRIYKLFLIGLPLVLGACPTDPPVRDLIAASSAMKAAERAQAEIKSPDLFRRAENFYWRAKQLYLAKEYTPAKKAATEARRLAEQAELEAEIKNGAEEGAY